MTKPIVHLAGNRVSIGCYSVQRCLICGAVMEEFNASRIASPDGSCIPEFALGGFYEFDGNRTSLILQTDSPYFQSDLDIPENTCIRLKDS